MDIQQIITTGVSLLKNSSILNGKEISSDTLKDAVQSLFGNGFDISKLLSAFGGENGIAGMVSNFMGGDMKISPEKITEIFGSDKINSFAQKLNIDEGSAKNAIADIVPGIVDKVKEEGGEDILNQAKDLLGKFF